MPTHSDEPQLLGATCFSCRGALICEASGTALDWFPQCAHCLHKDRSRELRQEARNFQDAAEAICSAAAALDEDEAHRGVRDELIAMSLRLATSSDALRAQAKQRRRLSRRPRED